MPNITMSTGLDLSEDFERGFLQRLRHPTQLRQAPQPFVIFSLLERTQERCEIGDFLLG
jgi:hypothetical protein